jgi:N-glycosylase/DNA lyase
LEPVVSEKANNLIIEGQANFRLESIMECGQCFRWEANGTDDYTGIVKDKVVRIIQRKDKITVKGCTADEFHGFWHGYFDLGTDYAGIINELSQDDPVMKMATAFAPGIRILKQPLFETLISFIISANNSIPNIKSVIRKLSKMYGNKITFNDKVFYTFPAPETLAEADPDEIMLSKAGYRSKYIKKTAFDFSNDPITVEQLKKLGYEGAKNKLMEYCGVGAKVADCTLLFCGAYTNAFPVDVWVKKVMEELYFKKETPLRQISGYAKDKFGELGGYAQQYLFYYARSNL